MRDFYLELFYKSCSKEALEVAGRLLEAQQTWNDVEDWIVLYSLMNLTPPEVRVKTWDAAIAQMQISRSRLVGFRRRMRKLGLMQYNSSTRGWVLRSASKALRAARRYRDGVVTGKMALQAA